MNENIGSITGHKATDRNEYERRVVEIDDVSYTADLDEGGFRAGMVFRSFYYQVGFPISSRSLITRFLMLWLKWCISPSLSKDAIAINMVYPAVFLVYR